MDMIVLWNLIILFSVSKPHENRTISGLS